MRANTTHHRPAPARTRLLLLLVLGGWVASLLVALPGCSEGKVAIPSNPDGSQGDGSADTHDDDVTTSGDTSTTNPGDTSTTNPGDTTTTNPGDTTVPPNDTTTSGCTEGLTRCSPFTANVETCQGGVWNETQVCGNGCQQSTCLAAAVSGHCTNPVPIAVGQSIVATTDTLNNPGSWSQDCRNSYKQTTGVTTSPTGPETVFELTVPSPMMLRFKVDGIDPTLFAFYIRTECNAIDSEVHSVCGGSAASGGDYEVETFLAPGTYYVYVDDFGSDGDGPGTFELTVEQILLPECGARVPVPLDVSGQLNLSDDTANGATSNAWNPSSLECPDTVRIADSHGPELIYAFGLATASQVNIAATPTDPNDSEIALYVRSKCADRYAQVGCGYTSGSGSAVIQETLPAGGYYLFVDDFINSIDEPQAFDLTIDISPAP